MAATSPDRPADAAPPEPAGPLPAVGGRGRRTGPAEPPTNEPLGTDERPDVGLAQSGSGEDAIVRRETEI
ncbi:hypothetical protein BHAOGJBA_2528 [Methylobacterium hispanicum]|jgi:hypothetical protein|uniref:Uncharacterized protein n=1 Tax=Methylobacterium hispanicum TaxID=270350 RepID=A0AAV4ZL08_9HYPH|nr:hypothetical protein [Methylobacterium hispanicum]GJD89003.1 hypothetical protein BHAOGJBA_2528 [Methylobacterium hispanicum]